MRCPTIAARVVDLPLPVAPVTNSKPLSSASSSLSAGGAPSVSRRGHCSGRRRSTSDIPRVWAKALARSRAPQARVSAKSIWPCSCQCSNCAASSQSLSKFAISGAGKGAGCSLPCRRQRGAAELHRCRSETLCFTLRATISSSFITHPRNMNDIAHNLAQVRDKISGAAARCGRAPEEVTLLAVSKTKPASAIEEAIAAGQRAFGENYVQEGVEKINHFQQAGVSGLQWHFIGPLQSNKSRLVAEHFDWCHTVDRLKIATRLNEQRPAHLPPLKVLIQINISDEQSKSGIPLEALDGLAAEIAELPHLELRGLMAIPAPESEYVRQFAVARQMAVAFARLKTRYPTVDTLSLGMSDDMEAAIAAGSTMVRIGTAIFGARDYSK
ncbi:unnamed protein product [Klebsiella pneumoniae]|nr:unnamed protein product [Klebsiella pneumoniae]